MTTISIIAPNINVTVTSQTEPPAFGRSYSLICTVTGADPSLNVNITYQWFRAHPTSSGMVTRVGTDSSRLHLESLSLLDVGLYTCITTVSSSFLSEDIESISKTFELKFPGQSCMHVQTIYYQGCILYITLLITVLFIIINIQLHVSLILSNAFDCYYYSVQ